MNIAIVNAHWNNRGDEAAHRALWDGLRQRYPDSKLTILFKDRKPVTWFPEIPNVEYFPAQFKATLWDIGLAVLTRGALAKDPALKQTVSILSKADLIVYPPGGSVINDRFFWSKQLEYLTPFICARVFKIPMVVAAPSMGPYTSTPKRRLRKWLLQTPGVFCVREDISRRYLKTLGIDHNINVTMDLAFMNEISTDATERQLAKESELCAFLKAHSKVIGITISNFRWHVSFGKDAALSGRIQQSFHKMIDSLTECGYGVLLIPQLFGNQNDIDDLRDFVREGVHLMSDQLDAYAQQAVIAKLYAVIGMRYHSNIFAAKMGTPFLAVVYEEKMSGFLELAGLSEYGLPLEQLSFEALNKMFQMLEANHDVLQAKLSQALPEWRRRARRTVELLPSIQPVH